MTPQILSDKLQFGPTTHRTEPPGVVSRLSIHQTTTQCWSLPQALRGIEETGAAGIGISLQKLDQIGRHRAIRLLNRSPLRVTSLGWIGGFTGDHDQTFRTAVDEAIETVRLASAIGAEAVHVLSGTMGSHIRSHARRMLRDALRELIGVARQENVLLAVQPMHPIFEREWSFLSGIDETLDTLGQFSPGEVGLAFGTYHFWEEERLISRLKDLVPWISSVQLSDWRDPPRCDNDRVLPGDGVIPLADIVREFESCGYSGCYEIEVWSRDLWKQEPHGLIQKAVAQFCELPVAVPT